MITEQSTTLSEGLVSLIVPCYNAEPYIGRLIASLRQQSYRPLEVIFVDDGSTDNTPTILREAKEVLELQGNIVKIVTQQNAGVSSAINAGLKQFTGEFLTWPDADDWLSPESISERVQALRKYPAAGCIRCNATIIEHLTEREQGHFLEPPGISLSETPNLFADLLHIRTYFAPVCYMLRSHCFLQMNPRREIYVCKGAAQNLQMLLPTCYAFPCYEMRDVLAGYLVRDGSLSHSAKTPEARFRWDSLMCQVALETVKSIEGFSAAEFQKIENYYWEDRLLPTAFRLKLLPEALQLIDHCRLSQAKKQIFRAFAAIQCSNSMEIADMMLADVPSRILGKLFRSLLLARHANHI